MDYVPRILSGQSLDELRRELNDELLELARAVNELAAGEWTPTITFETPGNLSVAYSTRQGFYTVKDEVVTLYYTLITSTFTHTTASGNLELTGLPFKVRTDRLMANSLRFNGVTKTGATQAYALTLGTADDRLRFSMSGSGFAQGYITAADMPTGGSVILQGTINYFRKRK